MRDESDEIQDILDELVKIANKTPDLFRVEYHLAPEGCYAFIHRAGFEPFVYIPSKDKIQP